MAKKDWKPQKERTFQQRTILGYATWIIKSWKKGNTTLEYWRRVRQITWTDYHLVQLGDGTKLFDAGIYPKKALEFLNKYMEKN